MMNSTVPVEQVHEVCMNPAFSPEPVRFTVLNSTVERPSPERLGNSTPRTAIGVLMARFDLAEGLWYKK
jgi:hypothetical protein